MEVLTKPVVATSEAVAAASEAVAATSRAVATSGTVAATSGAVAASEGEYEQLLKHAGVHGKAMVERLAKRYPDLVSLVTTTRRRRGLLQGLASARETSGLTQRQVAAKMRSHQPTIAALERGDADPRLSTLERYASSLGLTFFWQLVDSDGKPACQAFQWEQRVGDRSVTSQSANMRLLDLFNPRPVTTAKKSSHDTSIRRLQSVWETILGATQAIGSVPSYDLIARQVVTETARDLHGRDQAIDEPNDPTDWRIRFVEVDTENTIQPHRDLRVGNILMAPAR